MGGLDVPSLPRALREKLMHRAAMADPLTAYRDDCDRVYLKDAEGLTQISFRRVRTKREAGEQYALAVRISELTREADDAT